MKSYGVIGGRSFSDKKKMKEVLDSYDVGKIVSGGCGGADTLGEEYADDNNIEKIIHEAKWKNEKGVYNPSAGFDRNTLIVRDSDEIIAFWNGRSNGTRDTIIKAIRNKKIPVHIYSY